MKRVLVLFIIAASWAVAVSVRADTMAYWRFEGNNGAFVADGTLVPITGTPIRDEIGGNHAVAVQRGGSVTGTGTAPIWQGDQAGELFGSQVPNPAPLDTSANGTFNANGVNTKSLFFNTDITIDPGYEANYHLMVADNSALDFSGAFTLEGYFCTSDTSQYRSLICKRDVDDGDRGYQVNATPTGDLRVGVDNGAANWFWISYNDAAVNDGVWHHFAAIRDASNNLHIWLDGVEDTTPGSGGTQDGSGDLSNAAPLAIGSDKIGLNTWNGYADEVRFSNVALSSNQFLNHVVPEPGTLTLLATGLIGLLCYAWRRRK